MQTKNILLVVSGVLATAGVAVADSPRPQHALPPSSNGDLVVGLCDGETSVQVKGHRAGQPLPRDKAQSVADELMGQWKKKNPKVGALWDKENLVAQASPPAAAPGGNKTDTSSHGATRPGAPAPTTAPGAVGAAPGQEGHTYGAFTSRDEAIWRASTQAFVDQGDKLFHDAKAIGGTIAVSCDMCHPNAANTHPETYPKFQVQLGKVALLRDMINWCIENPVRGKPLADDDPRMKALEAFILARRKGVALEYGKH
jgi:hypothetical protein